MVEALKGKSLKKQGQSMTNRENKFEIQSLLFYVEQILLKQWVYGGPRQLQVQVITRPLQTDGKTWHTVVLYGLNTQTRTHSGSHGFLWFSYWIISVGGCACEHCCGRFLTNFDFSYAIPQVFFCFRTPGDLILHPYYMICTVVKLEAPWTGRVLKSKVLTRIINGKVTRK